MLQGRTQSLVRAVLRWQPMRGERFKRLVNFSERRVSKPVGAVAEKHGAIVAHKVRIETRS